MSPTGGQTAHWGQEPRRPADVYKMSNQPATATLLVPPRRFGELLVQRRTEIGRSTLDVEQLAKGRFSAGDLVMFETGLASPTDEQLRHLAVVYGLDLSSITPQRAVLELDRAEGIVQIGHESERFDPDQDDREILLRYLAIVYRMRSINPGSSIPARTDDLSTLALVFSTTTDEIRSTLDALMLHDRPELRRRHQDLKRRLVVPGLGVLVALTSVGGLLLVRHTSGSAAVVPRPIAGVPVEIGNALVIERATPDGPGFSIGSALTVER